MAVAAVAVLPWPWHKLKFITVVAKCTKYSLRPSECMWEPFCQAAYQIP